MSAYPDFDNLAANLPALDSGPHIIPPRGFSSALTTLRRLEAVALNHPREAIAVVYAYVYAGEALRARWTQLGGLYVQVGKMALHGRSDRPIADEFAAKWGKRLLGKGLAEYEMAKPEDPKASGIVARILQLF